MEITLDDAPIARARLIYLGPSQGNVRPATGAEMSAIAALARCLRPDLSAGADAGGKPWSGSGRAKDSAALFFSPLAAVLVELRP